MTVAPHSEWFTIYTFQEDEKGTATVQALCSYMQEAAGNHADTLGLSIERLHAEGVAWVLARMRIAPESLPPVHARIQVETWPVGVEGLQYRRDFIVRGEDGTVFARAVSHWVVVSLASRKVGRVPSFIAGIALDNAETAMSDRKSRVPEAGKEYEAATFRARLADMDRNRHVNNVRYMDWIMESVPDSVRCGARLADMEIIFKSETLRGDAVSVRSMPAAPENPADMVFCHSLVREIDGRELARARTVWRSASG